jgi:hypothetical protein
MLDSLIHTHFVAGLISGGLAVGARDLAVGLFGGIGLLFTEAKKHPNAYVTPAQLDQFKTDIVTDIVTQGQAQVALPTVAVTVNPVPTPVPAKEPAAPPVPQYNQD